MSELAMKTQPTVSYTDYMRFSELEYDRITMHKLITLYRNIFSEPDGWAENYSYDEVYYNLKQELASNAHLRICIDSNDENEVIAFCWVQLLSLQNICNTINTVQHYNSIGTPDIFTPLSNLIGNEPMIYLHDLGVQKNLRGKLSLSKIIYPTLANISRKTGINKVFFWTIANTHVSSLAKRAGFDLLLIHSGMQFYSGSIDFSHHNTG